MTRFEPEIIQISHDILISPLPEFVLHTTISFHFHSNRLIEK